MSLKNQVIIIFISITIISIIVSSLFFYQSAKTSLLHQIHNNLEAISEAKKHLMMGLLNKRQEQIMLIQIRDKFTNEFLEILNNDNKEKRAIIREDLIETRDSIDSFKEIHLVSKEGKVILSSSEHQEGIDVSNWISFRHALQGEHCVHEIFYDKQGVLSHNISGVLSVKRQIVGVIIIKTEAVRILEVINNYTGLGETGETVIAKKLPSGETYFIAATRFQPTDEDSIVKPEDDNYAMTNALRGREGILDDYFDYRDKKVIASARYISATDWGLITKIDRKEAFAPITNLLWKILILAALLIVLAIAAAIYFAKKLTDPITELHRISNQIANGNLEKRIAYENKNEIGQLAINFNIMADKLVQSNKSLQLKIEEMNKVNESLNQFAHVVSHDLKSPLATLSGLLGLLRKSMTSNTQNENRKYIELAEITTKRMQELINGILHFSAASTTDEQKQLVYINELIHEILCQIEVPVHIEVAVENMPAIYMEKVLIMQVFQNLIDNSIKYMDKPSGKIGIGSKNTNGFLHFFVKDNGRGIGKRNYENIFKIFNKTNRISGIDSTGLGLSIVKKIIENKGGRIWVESEENIGSTFYFTLPIDRVSEPKEQ